MGLMPLPLKLVYSLESIPYLKLEKLRKFMGGGTSKIK